MDDQTHATPSTPTAAPTAPTVAPRKKARRGFAAMPVDTQRRLAALGGKASHAKGTGHQWTSAEARVAGERGGRSTGARRRTAKAT